MWLVIEMDEHDHIIDMPYACSSEEIALQMIEKEKERVVDIIEEDGEIIHIVHGGIWTIEKIGYYHDGNIPDRVLTTQEKIIEKLFDGVGE